MPRELGRSDLVHLRKDYNLHHSMNWTVGGRRGKDNPLLPDTNHGRADA